jgi:DNA polymerase sigma
MELLMTTISIAVKNKKIPEIKKRKKIMVKIDISVNKPVATMGIKLQKRFATIKFKIYLLGNFIR